MPARLASGFLRRFDVGGPWIPVREQLRRSRELDRLRTIRGLTAEEQAEADSLAHRAYMRAWRAANLEALK